MNSFMQSLSSAMIFCFLITTVGCSSNSSSDEDSDSKGETGVTTVSFEQSTYQSSESSPSLVVMLTRSGDLSSAVSVDYSTAPGTANEDDYIATNGTISWAAGDGDAKEITLQINDDSLEEGSENYSLVLSNPSAGASLGSTAEAVITIADDDLPDCIDLETTNITEDTLLDHPCYRVESTINVSDAATLTISPGVTLIFAEGRNLNVEADGVLSAQGTELLPIVFTGTIKTPGYWQGIEIRSVATSKIAHALIEYAGGSGFNEASVGVSFDGRLEMDFTTVEHGASYGVSVNSSSAILESFTNNIISGNEAPPIYIQANLLFTVDSSNQLTGNVDSFDEQYDFVQVADGNGRDVTRDQNWQNFGLPIHLSGLDVEAELTIEPGLTLVFAENTQLFVTDDGTLKAIGEEALPITFTAEQQTPGYWRGIQFTFNNNANEMNYCVVEYGGSDSNGDANVSVFGSDGRLAINNSTIRHSSQYGISFSDGIELTMEDNIIESNAHPVLIEVNDLGKLSQSNDYDNNTNDYIVVTGSTVATPQSFKDLGLPYRFVRTSTTAVDASLVIEPGVEIQFASNGGFRVDSTGSLNAVGTEALPIIFTGVEKVKGFWNGIQYTFSGTEQNVLDHVVLEYGGQPSGNTEGLVGYFGQNSGGTISNSIFRFSDTNGIWLDESSNVDYATGNTFENIDELNVYIDD